MDRAKLPWTRLMRTKNHSISYENDRAIISSDEKDVLPKRRVEAIIGPLIVILVGVPLPKQGTDEIRKNIVARICSSVGPRVSIIHGTETCPVGIVGTEIRKEYTAFIPDYRNILKCIVSMKAGTIEERNA